MIRIILSAILLLILPIQVWSNEEKLETDTGNEIVSLIEGKFRCEVKYQNILIFREAKANEYRSWPADQIKVGEFVDIIYQYIVYIPYGFTFEAEMLEVSIDKVPEIANDLLDNFEWGLKRLKPVNNILYDGRNAIFKRDTGASSLFLNEDRIQYDGLSSIITLKRYYKNDWSVLLVNSKSSQAWTIGLDCRHNTDRIAEIIDDYIDRGYKEE